MDNRDNHRVRTADVSTDAAACAEIYAHYVRFTTASFEYEAPTAEQMSTRIAGALQSHEWLVSELNGRVDGFAYAGRWNPRPAYDWSCETSIYLRPGSEGQGAGAALYEALMERLRSRGFRLALARIALPNDRSVRFHENFGFAEVGVHHNLGFKSGEWIDVLHTELQLAPPTSQPPPIRPSARVS
ncbi:MAG TPA: GNAT family N-acetyltransferase [Actinomycetes bacterium]|nr:GNAT family N-acetyltransferase [Actinomycetes bacterium]